VLLLLDMTWVTEHAAFTSPMMLTRPGLRATKSAGLPYMSLNFANKLSHRFVSTGNASWGYMSLSDDAVGTSMVLCNVRRPIENRRNVEKTRKRQDQNRRSARVIKRRKGRKSSGKCIAGCDSRMVGSRTFPS
jgi:hypothetical protein